MSSIEDINSILAIISASGSSVNDVPPSPSMTIKYDAVSLIRQYCKDLLLILKDRLVLFNIPIQDPYEQLYHFYWEQVFWGESNEG